jgi:hypothetical protein
MSKSPLCNDCYKSTQPPHPSRIDPVICHCISMPVKRVSWMQVSLACCSNMDLVPFKNLSATPLLRQLAPHWKLQWERLRWW